MNVEVSEITALPGLGVRGEERVELLARSNHVARKDVCVALLRDLCSAELALRHGVAHELRHHHRPNAGRVEPALLGPTR
jgi:hypothetical protein